MIKHILNQIRVVPDEIQCVISFGKYFLMFGSKYMESFTRICTLSISIYFSIKQLGSFVKVKLCMYDFRNEILPSAYKLVLTTDKNFKIPLETEQKNVFYR